MKPKATLILIGITLVVIVATYFGVKAIDKASEPPKITPTVVRIKPNTGIQDASGWRTYQAPEGLFSMQYPSEYSVDTRSSGASIIGRTIVWFQLSSPLFSCVGSGCPTIKQSQKLTLNNHDFTKYWGEYIDEESGVAQSFIQYEVALPSGKYLELKMSELPIDIGVESTKELYQDHKPSSIEKAREEILNTMASSIKF